MNLKAAGLPCRTLSTTYVITTAEVYQVGDGLGASHGCMHGRYPRCRGSRLSGPAHIADSASSGVQFAGPRSTAAKCSNAIGFDRASSCSNAQIRAQTHAVDRHAPSSQLGVRVRVSSPQKRLVSWPGSATGVVIIYCYQYYHSMDAATLIRMTRESAGLSQGALAARAGTSQPAVSRYESGASSPSVETLDRLLAVMGARLDLVAEGSPRRLDVRTPRMVKLRQNRERIRRAAHRHGAKNVRIFGSVARGADRPDSDIDLLVDFDVRSRGLFPLAGLQDELAALLGERVEVVPQDALAPHVAKNALAEAVPL